MLFLVPSILLVAALVQALTGFGAALVAMSVLPSLLSIRVAAPLMALIAITMEIVLLIRYRAAINMKAVWRMSLLSTIGIPIGIWLVRAVDERIVLTVLGMVLVSYSLYALRSLRLPELKHPSWAFLFGFLAGILSGAYNVAGPMAVIYGNCRRWPPDEFKSNLQAFFSINGFLVLLSHGLSGNLQPVVWRYYLAALPAIALGLFFGLKLDRRIDPRAFRKIVQIFLILMGLRLILAHNFSGLLQSIFSR
jgi:uncharacterized protein